MGTEYPVTGTTNPATLIAVDFGSNDALAIYGRDGQIARPKLPRVKGGKSISDAFTMVLPILLSQGDVVVESPTVGSSGVEPADIAEIVEASSGRLYVLSARAVKNYRLDNQLTWRKGARYASGEAEVIEIEPQPDVHLEDAEILYRIATESPERLKLWEMRTDRLVRTHTSVRPHDKRNYRGETPDLYMSRFPPFAFLPADLQELLGNGLGSKNADYSRSRAIPFAMAMDETGSETRSGYERIIGLYDHGFPSFYRRATIVLLHANAKRLAGVTRVAEVPRDVRKQAWKLTRKQIRQVYHLLKGTSNPVDGHSLSR